MSVYSASILRLGVESFHINQFKATNVNHSTTKSQLAAELGPAQPQLVPRSLFQYISCGFQLTWGMAVEHI